ncbi:hypothetical protein Y1Q_0015177 [Alligator mississippiensis]|uniref:Reverse transcriptase domain-containing protein n=1 Tax=Alligator mississippiensis TaxID=8496 RepID=A0A151P8V3_ALLMI|nr:hypothetical protein Y1Q_0015177 [Alligator mississippiensis]
MAGSLTAPEIDDQLSTGQKENLRALISEFWEVFKELPEEAGVVEYQIQTPPGRIASNHWRRLPRHLWLAVRKEIDRMKRLGIIEESRSPWRSPMVVVPKLDGLIWLCIDYRKVNEIMTFNAFPMPQVDDMLEKAGQAWYIFTLDLTKG